MHMVTHIRRTERRFDFFRRKPVFYPEIKVANIVAFGGTKCPAEFVVVRTLESDHPEGFARCTALSKQAPVC